MRLKGKSGDRNVRVSKREEDLRGELSREHFEDIIQHLINHSIVLRETSSTDDQPIYTLTHDSLIDELNTYLENNDDLQRWEVAQRYLNNGYEDWYQSRHSDKPLMLERNYYAYIWENRDVFGVLTARKYEYLVRCALNLGHESYIYWLDKLLQDQAKVNTAHTETAQESLLASILGDYLFSDDEYIQETAQSAFAASARAGEVSVETIKHLRASLQKATSTNTTVKRHRRIVAPVLWAWRRHLPWRDVVRIVPATTQVWMYRHRVPIVTSVLGSLVAATLIVAFILTNHYSKGTWEAFPPLYSGYVAAVAQPTGGSGDVYAVTQSGPQIGDGATVVRYDSGTAQWAIIGRNVTRHAVRAMLVTDVEGQRNIYISNQSTGLIRSTDEGKNWRQINAGLRSYDIFGLIAHPDDANVLYAGAADRKGIYQSLDRGDTWEELSGEVLFATAVTAMAFGRQQGRFHLIVGTDDGRILKYLGSEGAWEPVATIPGAGQFTAMVADQESYRMMYAGTANGKFLVSEDGGDIWIPRDFIPGMFAIEALAVEPGSPEQVYASAYGFGGHVLWLSGDAGKNWQPVNNNAYNREYIHSIIPSPYTPENLLVAGAAGLFEIQDQGRTWTTHDLHTPLSPVLRLEISSALNGPIYATNNGSLFTIPRGQPEKWQRGINLPALEVRAIESDIRGPQIAFAGVYLPQKWSVFITRDGGVTWQPTIMPPIYEGLVNDTTTLALAQGLDGPILYVGTNGCGVIHSVDYGQSWETFGRTDCTLNDKSPRNIADIAVDARHSDRVIVAADNNSVYISNDRGKTWERFNLPLQNQIGSIAVDPKIAGRIYVTAGVDRFWRSDDGGHTWHKYSNTLKEVAVEGLTVVPNRAETLFIVADNGEVWKTVDGGDTWISIRQNLKVTGLTSVVFDLQMNELLVSSRNGGVYRYRPGILENVRRW